MPGACPRGDGFDELGGFHAADWLAAGEVEASWGAPVSSPGALRRERKFRRAAPLVRRGPRGLPAAVRKVVV